MRAINDLQCYASMNWMAENEAELTSGRHLPTKVTHWLSILGQIRSVKRGDLKVSDSRVRPETRQAIELAQHHASAQVEGLDFADYCAANNLSYIENPQLDDGVYRSLPLDPIIWGHVSAAEHAWPYSVAGASMAALDPG